MPLNGQVTILREERESDQDDLTRLRNTMETQAWSKALPPDYTVDMHVKAYHERSFSYDRSSARLVIEYKPSGKFAGYITYNNLKPRHSCIMGIVVAEEYWGTGVAFDAQETLLTFIFRELGVRVVRAYTTSGNEKAVGLAKKSGFQIAVRLREAVYKNGVLQDNLVMELLREDWFDLHPEYDDMLPAIT